MMYYSVSDTSILGKKALSTLAKLYISNIHVHELHLDYQGMIRSEFVF